MLLNKIKQNTSGSALLVISILVLTFILIVALGASAVVRNGIIMNRGQMDSTKAFFAAEAGAERILWEVWQNNYDVNNNCPADAKFCFDNIEGGVIDECIIETGTCSNEDQQRLPSNQALYSIKYEHLTDRATSTIVGNFADINSRVIKLIQ